MDLQKLIDGLKEHKYGAASYESVDEAIRVFEAMRDVDGEKVIKGLEFCIRNQWGVCSKECPYKMLCFYTEGEKVMKRLISDALALIRQQQERIAELEAAQTARVMTLEDVDTADDCMEPVFVEMLDENGNPSETPDIFSWRFAKHIKPLTDGKIYVLNNVGFSSALYEETYNITWRCWTKRPTDEQRKATQWAK